MTTEIDIEDDANGYRAGTADAPIRLFAEDAQIDMDLEADGPDVAVADMIGNMLHWLERNHPNGREAAFKAVSDGLGQYVQERIVPNDLGPDAHVSIQVACAGEEWTITPFGKIEIAGQPDLPTM